jgi:hypothetical protein
MRRTTLEMIAHGYRYPGQILRSWPERRWRILSYDELTGGEPGRVVLDLYSRFGFSASGEYRRVLDEETQKARSFKSEHACSLDDTGLTAEEIVREYRDVFARYGFYTHGHDLTEPWIVFPPTPRSLPSDISAPHLVEGLQRVSE